MRTVKPWGWYVVLFSTRHMWLKLLRVKGRTSLQMHAYRTELHLGTHFAYVKPFVLHRLTRGWYLEIAWGEPTEEDIIRLEDDYNRV